MFDHNKTFIIAELSANHNNDFDLAVKTIKAMALAGADAVKVQTYTPDSLALDLDNDFFGPIKDGLWKGIRRYDLYKQASMPYEWQPKLKKIAEDLGLVFFSSPFDLEAVDFLESFDCPMYKIASFEITDIPLIEYVASKKKPIIISTGVAELEDIKLAVDACLSKGNNDITLLKCTSQYPASIEAANLLTIPDMRQRFNVKVGVSDHTMGGLVPIVAVSLGAQMVEKHFILDRNLGGPDSPFSLQPDEFKQMVTDIRNAEKALGSVNYEVSNSDKNKRRSLFVTQDIAIGDTISIQNVRSLRPGYGMHPKVLIDYIGTSSTKKYRRGDPFI
jgi:pseudaminic acid synthase